MSSLVIRTKDVLRPLKRRLEQVLPRPLRVAAPVVQAFLGGEYLTRYTLVNFPSLYSPTTAHPCIYDIALYAADGSRVARRELRIAPYGSLEVRPEEVFGADLPDLGMFTARIRSASALTFAYKHLGTVTSHFYALYSDRRDRSLALVHPQTLINAASGAHMAWESGYLLDSGKLRKLVAIQVNPTSTVSTSSLHLVRAGANAERIGIRAGTIPAMGARKVSWDLADIGLTGGLFFIAANGLPTTNAKPVLLTHFEDGSFTGMHA
jgi:hypothetical protein